MADSPSREKFCQPLCPSFFFNERMCSSGNLDFLLIAIIPFIHCDQILKILFPDDFPSLSLFKNEKEDVLFRTYVFFLFIFNKENKEKERRSHERNFLIMIRSPVNFSLLFDRLLKERRKAIKERKEQWRSELKKFPFIHFVRLLNFLFHCE